MPTDIAMTAAPASHPWPARRFLAWCRMAWTMFMRNPFRLLGLAVLPMLVEAILQAGVPVLGVVLSKLVVPLASMWALLMVDQRCRTGVFAPAAALRRLAARPGAALALALLATAVFAVQMALAVLIVGPQPALAIATGDASGLDGVSRAQVSLVLASGLPMALLLLFTVPRVLLERRPLAASLVENLRLVAIGWRPVLVYLLLSVALVGGLVFQPWLLLPALLLGYVSYWAYRDAFAADAG